MNRKTKFIKSPILRQQAEAIGRYIDANPGKHTHDFIRGGPYINRDIICAGSLHRDEQSHVQHIVMTDNKFPVMDEKNTIVDDESNKMNDLILAKRTLRVSFNKKYLPKIDFPKASNILAEYIKNRPQGFPLKSSLRDDTWDNNNCY